MNVKKNIKLKYGEIAMNINNIRYVYCDQKSCTIGLNRHVVGLMVDIIGMILISKHLILEHVN